MENLGEPTKTTYTSPVLTEYGSLEKLTRGAAGNGIDVTSSHVPGGG